MSDETTGGGSGGASGAGGSQVENLVIGAKLNGVKESEQGLDSLGSAVVTTATNINDLSKIVEDNAQVQARATESVKNRTVAETVAAEAIAETAKVTQAAVDQGTAYLTQLERMVETYNMTTAELQRYKAENLGVAAAADASITAMEQMREATAKYGVVIKEVADIEAARLQWEKENAAALSGQRVQALVNQSQLEKESAAALKGQRIQALADQAQLEKEAAASLSGQRVQALQDQAQLEKESVASLKGQRIQAQEDQLQLEKESAAALKGQRIQALADQEQAEKEASASLKGQRIQALEDQAQMEKEAAASLNGQRVQALADQAQVEKEAAAALKGQRIQALQDQAQMEKEAMASLNGQRAQALADQAQLEKESAASLKGQRIDALSAQAQAEKEAAAALKGQRIDAIESNTEAARLQAEKLAIDEINWNNKSVQTRIQQLEVLKQYRDTEAISEQAMLDRFGAAAVKDLPNLERLKQTRAEALAELGRVNLTAEQTAEQLAEKQALAEINWSAKSVEARTVLIQKVKAAQVAGVSDETITKTFGAPAVRAAAEFEGALTGLGAALENNRVRTEALVLAHEALQGRFTRMPGSMMVMAEYLTSSGVNIGNFAAATLGVVGALGALAYEMEKGHDQQKDLANDLIRTNNYAGTTAGSLDVLAHSLGDVNGQYKEAYMAVGELTSSGKFTAEQISEISGAVVSLNHSMGTDLNKTIQEFETLTVKATSNGTKGSLEIARGLEALDQKYHFLNESVLDQVIALEKEGKEREAQEIAIKEYANATNKAAKESEDNIGWMEKAWDGVAAAIKRVGQEMADLGKNNLELRASKMREYLTAELPSSNLLSAKGFETDESKLTGGQIKDLHAYYDLLKQIDEAKAKAQATAAKDKLQSDANHVDIQRAIQDRSLMKKSNGEMTEAIEKDLEQLSIKQAANPAYMDDPKNVQYEQERMEAIVKQHSEKTKKVQNDGRKQELQDQLAADQQAYKEASEAADNDIALAKKNADANKETRNEEYQDITAAYSMQLKALQQSEAAQLATLYAYQPLNDVDAKEKIKRINEVVRAYQLGSKEIKDALGQTQEDVVNKAVKQTAIADNKDLGNMKQKIADQQKFNAEIGKTAEQKKLADSKLQDNILMNEQLEAVYQQSLADNENLSVVERATAEQRAKDLRDNIADRQKYNQLLQDAAKLEAQAAVDKQWAAADKEIEKDLENAIADGGGNGLKKLIRDMKSQFAHLILQPILAPISAGISSILYPNAAQAGGVAGAGGTSGLGAPISLASSAASAYKAVTGGIAGFTGSVGGGISSVGNMLGSSSIAEFGSGFSGSAAAASQALGAPMTAAASAGASASAAVPMVAAAIASYYISKAISGQYKVEGIGTALNYLGPVGGIVNRAFGMGSTQVQAQGLSGTLSESGVSNGLAYQDMHQDGGWFRSDKNWSDDKAIDSTTSAQLANGFTQLEQTTLGLAKSLNVSSSALDGYTKQFDIKLTGDATKDQQAVTEFFTSLGDELSNKLLPQLSQFSQTGETASQTLQRLSGEFEATNQAAQALGASADKMFGSLGVDSAAARERLINYSGGSSNVTSQAQFFEQNFMSQAQQLAPVVKSLNDGLASLGLTTIPQTRDQFAALVEDLVSSGAVATDAGAKEYASLMALADAFATVHPATQAIALTVDQARSDLSNSYKTEADAINQANDAMKSFSTSLKQLRNNSLLGNLSPLTPEQKYAQAKTEYDSVVSAIKNGNKDAQDQYQQAYSDFLSASQTVNASGDQYQQDFQYAQDMTDQLGKWADQQATVGQQTLDALNKQVNGLVEINDSTMSVSAAITQLGTAMGVNPNSIAGNDAAIKTLYEGLIGSDPTADQTSFWERRLNGGVSINEIAQSISQSGGDTSKVAPVTQQQASNPNVQWTNADIGRVVTAIGNVQVRLDLLRQENAQQAAFIATTQATTTQNSADQISDATTAAAHGGQIRIQPS